MPDHTVPESLYQNTGTNIFGTDPLRSSDVWNGQSPIATASIPFQYTTRNRPALAWFGNQIWCVYRSGYGDNRLCYTFSGYPDLSWSEEKPIPNQTTLEGPALAAFGNYLYCVYVGTGGDNKLYCTYWNGHDWSSARAFPSHYSAYEPALAAFDDKLWCVYTQNSRDNILHYATFDGDDWSVDAPFLQHNESAGGPALAASKSILLCLHRGGSGDENLWETTWDGTNGNWTEDKRTTTGIFPMDSSDGPCVIRRSDQTWFVAMFKGGTDNITPHTQLYLARRPDLTGVWDWGNIRAKGCKSQAGPALTSYVNGNGDVEYLAVYRGIDA